MTRRPELATRRWQKLRRQVLEADGYRCRQCGRPGRLEVDHITAVADGGDLWDPENLQALCRGCHVAKTRAEHDARHPLGPKAAAWAAFRDELR